MARIRPVVRAAAALAVAGLALDAAPVLAQAQYTIKIGSVTVRDPQHQYLDEFKKRIEERSGGRIAVGVYPASQLGDVNRMIEGVQLGTIEMLVSATGFYKTLHNAYQIGDAPGIFNDSEHAYKVLGDPEIRGKFLSLGEPKGAIGIGFFIYGPIVYVSSKPLRSIDDFKGKKIRTLASKIEGEICAKLGATGVPMPLSEAMSALQNNVVDGARGATLVFAAFKYYSVARYLTVLDDSVIPVVTMISKEFYRKLPPDLAKMVADTAGGMDDWAQQLTSTAHANAEKVWREGGGEVIRFSPAGQAEVRRRHLPIADELLGTQPDTRDMWNLLKRVAAKHK
jgi:C4-dicarboxylate-binding protein DctP